MELKQFDGMKKEELSMIEVAHAILDEKGDVLEFSELVTAIQKYLGITVGKMKKNTPQFYTDLNIDGSFISLGDNRWGLRSWYPIDSIDEEVSGIDEDDDETVRRKKRKKVNAFIATDEDAIDYNDDDPEDNDIDHDDEELYDEDDDEAKEIKEYTTDLSEIGDVDDTEDDETEGLTIVDEDDLDDDDLYDDEEEEEEVQD